MNMVMESGVISVTVTCSCSQQVFSAQAGVQACAVLKHVTLQARELEKSMAQKKWVHADALQGRIAVMESCGALIAGRLRDTNYAELVKNVSVINTGGVDLPFQMRCDLVLPQMINKFGQLADAQGKKASHAVVQQLVQVFAVWQDPQLDFSDLDLHFNNVLASRQSELRLQAKRGLISADEQRTLLDASYEAGGHAVHSCSHCSCVLLLMLLLRRLFPRRCLRRLRAVHSSTC